MNERVYEFRFSRKSNQGMFLSMYKSNDQEKSILRINDNLTETQQAAEKVGIEQKSVAQVAEAQANTQRKIAKIIGEEV